MHCYRIQLFNQDMGWLLSATQQEAFASARAYTTDHRQPQIDLINLPIDKASIITLANDADGVIGKCPAMKSWEAYKRGGQAVIRELDEAGEPAAQTRQDKPPKARKQRVDKSVREAAKVNPHGWPQSLIINKKGL